VNAIELRDVTLRLGGRDVLSGVSLEIPTGEFVGVLGPNGSGKTTLMRAILGLPPASRGNSVCSAGQRLAATQHWRHQSCGAGPRGPHENVSETNPVVDHVPITSDFPARFPAQRSAGKKLSLLLYGDLPTKL